MNRARRHEHVNPVAVSAFDRSMDFLNIAGIAAGKATDNRAEVSLSNLFHCLKIARRCRGKTGFDDVDIQLGEGLGDAQLFADGHAAARGLFSIAEGCIENAYGVV